MNQAPAVKLSISLPANDWNYILGALSKQPFSDVVGLMNEIQRQAAEQAKPQDASDPAE